MVIANNKTKLIVFVFIIGIVFFSLVSFVSAINCSDLTSNSYTRIDLIISGENYTESTVQINGENITRLNYIDYGFELAEVYDVSEKYFNIDSLDDSILLKGEIFRNKISLCELDLPAPKYTDIEAISFGFSGVVVHSFSIPNSGNLTLRISNGVTRLKEYDLSNLLCNYDGVCDGMEDYNTCSSDCAINAKDGLCIKQEQGFGDGLCDSDCYNDADCVNFCNDGILNGNEEYTDFGGGCGYENKSFCSNKQFDVGLEDSLDCGGYCDNACGNDLLSIMTAAKLYTQTKMDYFDLFNRIFFWTK